MDALAGYGSDDSSVSETQAQGNNPLAGLVGADSDDDESSDEVQPSKSTTTAQPATKRQRTEQVSKFVFAAPFTSNNSTTHWDVDFLSQKTTADDSPSNQGLSQKLEKLAKSLKVSWADHLKAQHEFHNPHFFESVVEHFGISDTLGSQMGGVVRPLENYEAEMFGYCTEEP